jgi:hypothetical protein
VRVRALVNGSLGRRGGGRKKDRRVKGPKKDQSDTTTIYALDNDHGEFNDQLMDLNATLNSKK